MAAVVPSDLPADVWTTGCGGCFEDCSTCCLGFWCPCVMIGRIAEISSSGGTDCATAGCLWFWIQACLPGCGCLYSHMVRGQLRSKFKLPAEPCPDLLMHWCCLGLSICQEYRELKNRGWEPYKDYATSLAKSISPETQLMTRFT